VGTRTAGGRGKKLPLKLPSISRTQEHLTEETLITLLESQCLEQPESYKNYQISKLSPQPSLINSS